MKSSSLFENQSDQSIKPERELPQYLGIGVCRSKGDIVLDVWFPYIIDQSELSAEMFKELEMDCVQSPSQEIAKYLIGTHSVEPDLFNCQSSDYSESRPIIFGLSKIDQPIQSTEEAYLKLHLISSRKVTPHALNLNQLFGVLPNIAWTNIGPILPQDLNQVKLSNWKNSMISVTHVDKFPYLVNYVVPSGVRIASGSQVRLGAYLGEGTTIMPAGYVNFNAGTMGNAMVEGRVSAGVIVDKHTDIGGGASIMGTLSGGNSTVISIGSQCLLGANAGTGISLGKGCTIAAGLYIYAGMKIHCYDEQNNPIDLNGDRVKKGENCVKASELSGRDYMLFIQDSITGEVKMVPNRKLIELNEELHSNQ